ncbi:hypothetical protein GGR53DRAFT_200510 [Hypoxylon sp. FL1150]|nr:hypothetical protein GGR53DRAFT_200510 [Hypoxylon sp. FL1150]
MTGIIVEKIIFEKSGNSPKATVVQLKKDDDTPVVRTVREVIVGSRERLEQLSILVVVHNSNVEENLQDHLNAGDSLEVVNSVKTMDGLKKNHLFCHS